MNEIIEKARALGADVDTGLKRCVGKEDLYAKLIVTALKDKNFEKLSEAVGKGDTEEAFNAAHALKGVLSNLALSPLTEEVVAVTERLRAGEKLQTSELQEIVKLRDKYRESVGEI